MVLYKKDWSNVVMLFALIVFVRVMFLMNWQFMLDGDESVVGIMAKHILEGESNPIFYYGQNYMGTLEQYSAALLFFFFGVSPFILKIVPLIYYIFSVLLVFLILKREFNKNLSQYFLAFSIFPSLFVINWSMKARGAYLGIVFLCSLFIYLLFKYQVNPKSRYYFAMFFIAGFSLYLNILSAPFLVVVTFIHLLDSGKKCVAMSNRSAILNLIYAVFFLFLGFLPSLIGSEVGVSSDLLNQLSLSFSQIIENIRVVVISLIPLVLGFYFSVYNEVSVFSIAEFLLFFLSFMSILIVFYGYSRYFSKLIFLKKEGYPKSFYFIVVFLSYIAVLVFSPFQLFMPNPEVVLQHQDNINALVGVIPLYLPLVRYMIFGVILIPLITFLAFVIIYKKNEKFANLFFFCVVLLGCISSSQVFYFNNDVNDSTFSHKAFASSKNYFNLIDFLESKNLLYGYADYYDQFNINFISGENIKLATRPLFEYSGPDNRYSEYLELANQNTDSQVNIYYDTQALVSDSLRKKYNIKLNHDYRVIDNFIVIYPSYE